MADGVPARRKQRWFIYVFFFLSGILSASWSSRLPDVQHSLGVNNATFGSIIFFLYGGLFLGLSVASWLVTTFGSKKVMMITCILAALLLVIAGTVSSMLLLVFVLFLMGFVRTIFNLAANTGAIEVQTIYERPIIAAFHGIWSLACFVAGSIGQLMINFHISPFFHFLFIAVVVCISIALLQDKNQQRSIVKERRPFFVKPDRYLFLLGLMALCTMLCEGAMFDWSVNYFQKVVGAGSSFQTAGYLSFLFAMAFGRLIGDRFIAELGLFRLLLLNGVLMAAGFCIAASWPFVIPAALGFLLIGIGDAVMVPIIYVLATRSKKMPPAYALSVVTFIGYIGFLIGPVFIGNASQYLGMTVAFYLLGLISIMIIIIGYFVKKRLRLIESDLHAGQITKTRAAAIGRTGK